MRVLIVLAAIAAAVAAAPRNQQRIVGGSLTTINSYPDIVALLVQTGTVFTQECGGAIINNRAFLSAAHCFYNSAPFFWRGRVGSTYANSGGFVYAVSRIVIHPYYNSYTEDSDIAVLLTSAGISFSGVVAPASIAGPYYNLFDNQVVWGAGWGVTFFGGVKSEQLRHVQIWTVNQQICWQRYASVGLTITDNMLCSGWLDVGGRDMCTGDSGGPLYHNRNVVGVSSFGVSCANPRYPGVNTRVSRFALWIQAVAESA